MSLGRSSKKLEDIAKMYVNFTKQLNKICCESAMGTDELEQIISRQIVAEGSEFLGTALQLQVSLSRSILSADRKLQESEIENTFSMGNTERVIAPSSQNSRKPSRFESKNKNGVFYYSYVTL